MKRISYFTSRNAPPIKKLYFPNPPTHTTDLLPYYLPISDFWCSIKVVERKYY